MAHHLIRIERPSLPVPEPETAWICWVWRYILLPPFIIRVDWKRLRCIVFKPPILVAIILFILTGLAFFPGLLSDRGNVDFVFIPEGFTWPESGVQILGDLVNFDSSDPSKVSVRWSIYGSGAYAYFGSNDAFDDVLPPNIAVDVYIDDPTKPAFSYDPKLLPMKTAYQPLHVASLYSLTQQHEIDYGTQYFAPWDSYIFSVFVLAIDKATNASLPISLFQIYSYGLAGDFAATSEVSPSKSLFPYNPGSGPTETQAWVMSHTMFGTIKRSLPARALTYTMFSINWVLALCSMVTTSVSFHRGSGNNDVGMTLLPITVILSIPTIRNLYVGSPPFGIFIDAVGFFPQMLIVALCTVIVLSGYAVRSTRTKGVGNGEKDEAGVLGDDQPLSFVP